jgi:dolichol-phosphate mannosyltransferase
VVSVAAGLLLVAHAVGRLFMGQQWPAGFATLAVLTLLSTSLNALFFGILGEYLGRVYRQVRREPRVVIETERNTAAASAAASREDVARAA